MKHAYLIMAHNDPLQLQKLVSAVDDERNSIFIHIDKKSDIGQFKDIKATKADLTVIDERIDTRWGDPSQIDTEYALFRAAFRDPDILRFHLLSGADFPLKSQDEMHSFFQNYPDSEFIDFEGSEEGDDNKLRKEIYKKCHLYHFFLPSIKDRNRIKAKALNFIRRVFMLMQMIVKTNRQFSLGTLYKGSQWGSFTRSFVAKLLEKEDIVKKEFQKTHCCDEIYKQTIAKAEGFKVSPLGNVRLIDFARGSKQSPYTFKESDSQELLSSSMIFARKFSSKESGNVCEIISSSF